MGNASNDLRPVKTEFEHHRTAVDVCSEAAKVVGQPWREHRQDGMREVHGGCSGPRCPVQWRVDADVGRHVCNGNPEGGLVPGKTDCIVEIFGVMGVDGHERQVPQVHSTRGHVRGSVHFLQRIRGLDQVRLPCFGEGVVAQTCTLAEARFDQTTCIDGSGRVQEVRYVRCIFAETEAANSPRPRQQRLPEVEGVPHQQSFSLEQGPVVWPRFERFLKQPALKDLGEQRVRAFGPVQPCLPALLGLRGRLDGFEGTQSNAVV